MPPKNNLLKPPGPKPSSKELVPVRPRHVATSSLSQQGKRDANGDKPSTSRALVLRNGKYGARGTGELVLMSKISGREKLDLLAEDVMEKSKMALLRPFRLEQCLKIAESQCDVFLDDISNLQDHQLFSDIIKDELEARTPSGLQPDPRNNATYVAKAAGIRIHNSYMLASAWRITLKTLNAFANEGFSDLTIKARLKNNEQFRTRYLVLYDMVNDLVDIHQARFSVLATTTPHYSGFFKKSDVSSDPNEPEMVFNWGNKLRDATLSFLDSIIIELCFPDSPYPKAVLYQLLRDVVEESPKEAQRFPQMLWDAIGDLSIAVELHQILEAPLLGLEEAGWRKSANSRNMPEEYQHWLDAQVLSETASGKIGNFKDIIYPLEKTQNKDVLDDVWKFINLNYQAVSENNIDALWQLEGAFDYAPQWSSYYKPPVDGDSDDSDSFKVNRTKRKTKVSKRLAITAAAAADSDDSMPSLQSVSNSSDGSDSDHYSNSDDDFDESSEESEYDEDHEGEIKEMLREAMDVAYGTDWYESVNKPKEKDPLEDDRKGNPFLNLLGSLRGRMFSSSPKLKSADRRESLTSKARGAFRATPSGVPKPVLSTYPPSPQIKEKQQKSQKPTVEEVEDEDAAPQTLTHKKKKKKPKKKKKTVSTATQSPLSVEAAGTAIDALSLDETAPAKLPPISHSKKALQPPKSPRSSVQKPVPPQMSTVSLLPESTTAQSARSYLQTENLDKEKSKVKSRPDHASIFFKSAERKRLFPNVHKKDPSLSEEAQKDAKSSWFSMLGKKTTDYMHQLLKTQEETKLVPMKWENFLKLMREMGFSYDPSTAGSSVRFDPPNKGDKPITIHKPHPDTTIIPATLRSIAKRLKKRYGWNEDDFLRQTY